MSTQTEILRLQTARNTIRDKAVELGLGTSTDKIDALATAIDGIVNQGAVDANVKEGESYTIPKGYHNGSGTVKGVTGGGNYTLQTKTVTPTKKQQSITPDQGYYGLSGVTVNAIPESYQNVSGVTAAAGDVLSGKVIVNAKGETVAGTMADNGSVNKTLDASTGNQTYTVPGGKHSGSGTVKIVLEEKSITPSKSAQTATPSTGKVLSKVSVDAIPSNYGDVSDADGAAADLLVDKILYGKNASGAAVKITGTMPDNGAISGSIDGLNTISYTVPAGYTSGGSVSLTSDIEEALAAI